MSSTISEQQGVADLLRVLVVDDTATYRNILRRAVDEISIARVAAVASNGRIALERLSEETIHVVVMDIEMPEMDGLETLSHIRRGWPEIGVVLVSGGSRTAAERTVEALSSGALDFVPKIDGDGPEEHQARLVANLRRVLLLFQTKCNLAFAKKHTNAAPAIVTSVLARTRRFRALAIGASTGGPQALGQLVPRLPADLRVPVFIVQHMPPAFTTALANLLHAKSTLKVVEAEDGQLVEPGVVYLAPGGRHMVVRTDANADEQRRVGLTDSPPVQNVRPSADVLFRSVAASYQGDVLSVVLTGMGQDGVGGVRALKQRGCYCITQSEASCVIYGMPRAVNEAGFADEQLDIGRIPARLVQLLA